MRKIHFIGIGGIGVSALAKFYLGRNWQVSGSDLEASEITKDLEKLRAQIFIGKHRAQNIPKDIDLVIYTSAVSPKNPELKKAYKLPRRRASSLRGKQTTNYKLRILSYPQALGQLTKKYFTIAVSGTHGKSTTSALISLILIRAGLDPTVILGTKLREFGESNFRQGKSQYLVIEADEWQAAFLNYFPRIIVLTNIEKEHVDYYKDLSHILQTYARYIKKLPKGGVLITNKDDRNILQIVKATKKLKVIFYSFKQKERKKIKKILKIPGIHNISNALAALSVARILKIPDKISLRALSDYKGAWRRFEIFTKHLNAKPYTLISDYAHHPTEIKATLQAVREKFKKRRIFAVFQPHQYQRTYYLFNEFVEAFDGADEIVLTDIYEVAGREEGKISQKVSARKLAKELEKKGKKVYFFKDFAKIPQFLEKKIKRRDVILIMGAGSIYKLVDFLG